MPTTTRLLAISIASTLSLVAIGCQGPPGPPGPPGAAGPPGPAGGALALYQRSTSFTCSGGANCNVPVLVAACDPGDVAVSGSAFRIAPGFPDQDRVSFPQPRGVTTPPTGWTTGLGNMPDGHTITVVAICADQTP
jgi:hypothetical protein